MSAGRQFPVLGHGEIPGAPASVPRKLLEGPEIESRIRQVHSQTLDRLAERGGLSIGEIAGHLRGSSWHELSRLGMRENRQEALDVVTQALSVLEASP